MDWVEKALPQEEVVNNEEAVIWQRLFGLWLSVSRVRQRNDKRSAETLPLDHATGIEVEIL